MKISHIIMFINCSKICANFFLRCLGSEREQIIDFVSKTISYFISPAVDNYLM